MGRSALVGGVLLALIEGMGLALNRLFAEEFRPAAVAGTRAPHPQ